MDELLQCLLATSESREGQGFAAGLWVVGVQRSLSPPPSLQHFFLKSTT